MTSHPALLSPKAVTAQTSLSRTTVDRMRAAGAFPQAVRLSPGRIAFRADEITAWLEARERERQAATSHEAAS